MRGDVIIRVRPDGTVRALHTDGIDLLALGCADIRRVTNIEFNNAKQRWEVHPVEKGRTHARVLFSNSSREECLLWEAKNILRVIDESEKQKQRRTKRPCGKNCKKS